MEDFSDEKASMFWGNSHLPWPEGSEDRLDFDFAATKHESLILATSGILQISILDSWATKYHH